MAVLVTAQHGGQDIGRVLQRGDLTFDARTVDTFERRLLSELVGDHARVALDRDAGDHDLGDDLLVVGVGEGAGWHDVRTRERIGAIDARLLVGGVGHAAAAPSGPKMPSWRPTAIWSSVTTTSNGDVVAGAAVDEARRLAVVRTGAGREREHENRRNRDQQTHGGGGYRAWRVRRGHGHGG